MKDNSLVSMYSDLMLFKSKYYFFDIDLPSFLYILSKDYSAGPHPSGDDHDREELALSSGDGGQLPLGGEGQVSSVMSIINLPQKMD